MTHKESAERRRKIVQDAKQGMLSNVICRKHKVSLDYVRTLCIEHGVSLYHAQRCRSMRHSLPLAFKILRALMNGHTQSIVAQTFHVSREYVRQVKELEKTHLNVCQL